MSQKNILCFGDSNTYGYSPSGNRYDENTRWPRLLETLLGSEYHVIEEGFNGRTTVMDDPLEGGYKSGAQYLPPCLMSHNPLDLVILMLGTNDTKQRFGLNAHTIAQGNMMLIRQILQYGQTAQGAAPRVLLVSPPTIGDWVMDTLSGPIFGPEAPAISRSLAKEYQRFSRLMRCEFLNAAEFVSPSREDAVHLSRQAHADLAHALCEKVKSIL